MTKPPKLARPAGPFLILVLTSEGRIAIQTPNGKPIPIRDFNPRPMLETRLAAQAKTHETIRAIATQESIPAPKPGPKAKPLAQTPAPLTSWRSLGGGVAVRVMPAGLTGAQLAAQSMRAIPCGPISSAGIDF